MKDPMKYSVLRFLYRHNWEIPVLVEFLFHLAQAKQIIRVTDITFGASIPAVETFYLQMDQAAF